MQFDVVRRVPRRDENGQKYYKYYKEGTCTSDEDKPMDLADGSQLREIDTATVFHFDEAKTKWWPWRRT